MSNNSKQPKPLDPGKKYNIVYFSDAKINLLREVKEHPLLVARLAALPAPEGQQPEWGEQLAEIAAHVNAMMEGMYLEKDLEYVYKDIRNRLRVKRSTITMASGSITLV